MSGRRREPVKNYPVDTRGRWTMDEAREREEEDEGGPKKIREKTEL